MHPAAPRRDRQGLEPRHRRAAAHPQRPDQDLAEHQPHQDLPLRQPLRRPRHQPDRGHRGGRHRGRHPDARAQDPGTGVGRRLVRRRRVCSRRPGPLRLCLRLRLQGHQPRDPDRRTCRPRCSSCSQIINQAATPINQVVDQVVQLLTQVGGTLQIPGLGSLGLGTKKGKTTGHSAESSAYALKIEVDSPVDGSKTVVELGRATSRISDPVPSGRLPHHDVRAHASTWATCCRSVASARPPSPARAPAARPGARPSRRPPCRVS